MKKKTGYEKNFYRQKINHYGLFDSNNSLFGNKHNKLIKIKGFLAIILTDL
jgi:hypothetical protein